MLIGLFFTNQQELVEDVLKLSTDEELLNELKKNARKSVAPFSLKNAYQEQIKIYETEL